MELPEDQNSNTTRPSTTLFTRELFEPDTNTSEHNPLLSPPLPPFDWPPDPPHPHSSQSQQINNSLAGHQPSPLPPNRLGRVLSQPNGMVASQQNQQLGNSLHSHQQQNSQHPQKVHYQHCQQHELEKDEFLLMNTQHPTQHHPSLLNTQPTHNQTQSHQPSEPASQAQSDLLNFGPTLQQQIQQQDRQLRTIEKRDQPMDIESDSQGYLFEKESHKNLEVYREREKQWDVDTKQWDIDNKQWDVNDNEQDEQSQSGIQEDGMPEQNSNLFNYGFTKTKKQPDPDICGSKNELPQHREQAEQQQVVEQSKQNQNIQVQKITVQIEKIANRQDQKSHEQQHVDIPNQIVQIPTPIQTIAIPIQTNAIPTPYDNHHALKQTNHIHPDQSMLLSSDEANLDSQLNYRSEEAKVFSQVHSQSNGHPTRRESTSQQDRALLGGYYDAESNSQSQAHLQLNSRQQYAKQAQQNVVIQQQPAAERQLEKQQIQTNEIENIVPVEQVEVLKKQQLAPQQQPSQQPQHYSANAQQLDQANQHIYANSQPIGRNTYNINRQANQPSNHHHPLLQSQQLIESQQQQPTPQEQPHQFNHQQQQQRDEVQSPRQYLQSSQPSIQSVTTELQQLLQNHTHQSDDQRFDQFQIIIKPHINLLFLKPNDSIGQSILQNGQLAILFAQLMVLKESFEQERKLLLKYLLAVLSRNITTNQADFQHYRESCNIRKSKRFTIVDQVVSIRNSPQKQQPEEQQSINNYSVEVHATSTQQDPKSIIKSTKKGKIKQHRTEMPVKRNNLQLDKSNNRSVQQSAKRDTRQQINNRKAKATKKRVTINERNLGSYNLKLGYTQTFVTVVDRSGRQVLKSTRVSRRLLQKSNNKQKESKPKQGGRSPTRNSLLIKSNQNLDTSKRQSPSRSKNRVISIKRSVRKSEHESEVLNADYIKSHFQELNIDVDKLELSDSFLTEADKQISKVLIDYQQAVLEEKRLEQKKRQEEERMLQPSQQLFLDLVQSQPTASQQPLENCENDNQQHSNHSDSKQQQSQLSRQLQAHKKKKQKLKQQLTQLTQKHILVQKVVEPDVNHHGIYALIKVKNSTAVLFRARYFLIPMVHLQFCSRKVIDEDIKTIKQLVEEEERDNIGILNPTLTLMQIIETEKRERGKMKTG